MKTLPLMLTCLLSLFVASSALAGNESQKEQAALSQLMKAVSDNDYDAFFIPELQCSKKTSRSRLLTRLQVSSVC